MEFNQETPLPTESIFTQSAVIEEVIQHIAPQLLVHPSEMQAIYTYIFSNTDKKQLCNKQLCNTLMKNTSFKTETSELLLTIIQGMRATAQHYALQSGGEFDNFMAWKKENCFHQLGLSDTEIPLSWAEAQTDGQQFAKQNSRK